MSQFSIIVPVYKVEQYLQECVDSVLNQTFKDFELILVDDGSPDRCPQMCDEYSKQDNRVKVIHKENGGLSSARNAGLDIAKGTYIMFLDSDDYWDDCEALIKIYNAVIQTKADVCIFGYKKLYNKNHVVISTKWEIAENINMEYLMENNIFVTSACDKILKRDIIERNNMRFVQGQLSEDIEWCVKILLNTRKITAIDEPFYIYRKTNAGSISSNIGRKNIEDISNVIIKYADIAKEHNLTDVNHYLAQQYILWLIISNRVKDSEIADLLKKMKEYWYLVNYCRYPYVYKVNKFKCMGFTVVRKMLGVYARINNILKVLH